MHLNTNQTNSNVLSYFPNDARIVIMDEQPLFRKGLLQVLNNLAGNNSIFEVTCHESILPVIHEVKPDLLIVDFGYEINKVYQLIEKIKQAEPSTKILVLTALRDENLITNSLVIGVNGIVLKDSDTNEIIQAIKYIFAGKTYLDPNITDVIIDNMKKFHSKVSSLESLSSIECLTVREKEICKLVIQGFTNKEIACKLVIANSTVHNHLVSAYRKLGICKRSQLIAHFSHNI